MKRLLPLVLGAALLASVGVSAQTPRQVTPTPTPTATPDLDVFQEVVVGGWAYQVDPFFPCVLYLTARTTRLEPDVGVLTRVTFQPFVRSGEEMIATDAFSTVESEITEDVAVGGTMVCTPQLPVDGSPTP